MVKYVPLMAIVIVAISSIWRIIWVKKTAGGSAWAFGSAKGLQQLAGISFAISIAALLICAMLYARFGGQNLYAAYTGSLLCVLGAAIVIIAQIQMGESWRIGIRPDDAPGLIDTGLFRYSRNPIFLGMMIIAIGTALGSGFWWAWIACLVFVLSCHSQVKFEEPHLIGHFGDNYRKYCEQVRRWM